MAQLAARSKGVVTRAGLLAVGVTPAEMRHRLAAGSLIVEFRGVYRVGHRAPNVETTYLAAVLACGAGALLCDRPAAHLLHLVKGNAPAPVVVARGEHRVPGLETRRCRTLSPLDGTRYRGIPVTTVPRTLVDLAGATKLDPLARMCHEAEVLHRTRPTDVDAVLRRRPNTAGIWKLRAILNGDALVTLSELERAFVALLRAHGLPLPLTNRPAGAYWVDCRWPTQRLTVELNSYRFHHSRHAWEQDARRERDARARGDEFRRFTYGDVVENPGYVASEMRRLLR
jgi:very-short-patch-repair endonuclease